MANGRSARSSSVLVALLARSCASIAVPTRVSDLIDAAAFSRAKRRAVSESWTQKLDVEAFLSRAGLTHEQSARPPPFVLDVRAPCEYERGHIPGALSFPLFDDEERAEVGTLYNHKGHDVAVARGVQLLDAKAPTFLDALPAGLQSGDELLVYCKRGGMRSGGMAQLLSEGDLRVHTLQACTPPPPRCCAAVLPRRYATALPRCCICRVYRICRICCAPAPHAVPPVLGRTGTRATGRGPTPLRDILEVSRPAHFRTTIPGSSRTSVRGTKLHNSPR